MGREMLRLLLAITWIGLITAASSIRVSGELHSDIHFPMRDACGSNKTFCFDIIKGSDKIGSYDGELQGLKSYENRLKYSNCTIILMNLTEQDGTRFGVTLYYNIKNTLEPHELNYEVIIRAPSPSPHTEDTTRTPAEHTTYNVSRKSTDVLLSFVSLCFSLDSPVNVLFTFMPSILERCCNKLRLNGVDLSNQINCVFTVIFQLLSISTMFGAGSSYGWLLILITIILLVGWFFPCFLAAPRITHVMNRCCSSFIDDMSSSCRKTALEALRMLTLLLQLLFAICAGLLHYRFNGDISRQESPNVGYAFLSVGLSFVWRKAVLIGTCCYKSGHKKFTAVPKNKMKTANVNPKETVRPLNEDSGHPDVVGHLTTDSV